MSVTSSGFGMVRPWVWRMCERLLARPLEEGWKCWGQKRQSKGEAGCSLSFSMFMSSESELLLLFGLLGAELTSTAFSTCVWNTSREMGRSIATRRLRLYTLSVMSAAAILILG